MEHSVYLSGPITGFTYDEAKAWRDEVSDYLKTFGINSFSPLRGKDYLREKGVIKSGDTYQQVLSTDQGITARDSHDVRTCDLIFVNLLGTKQLSIGTIMEIAWAQILNKPIVLVIEKKNNLHDYPMIREACAWRTDDLKEAMRITRHILVHF